LKEAIDDDADESWELLSGHEEANGPATTEMKDG